jgi:predicted RNA-binding protein YlqC (UPF0109 family)
MKEITKAIAQALVDNPERVSVAMIDSEHTSILKLSVGNGEAGKIIGKQGRTADALRTILNAVAAKERKRVILEVVDDQNFSSRLMQSDSPRIQRVPHARR